jgi:predicted nucleotidyltransferase
MIRGLLIEGTRVAMQQASRVPWAKAGLQVTYQRVAAAAAQVLVRLDGVRAVYLAGSVTTPERIEPGWSDIDLVLITDLPNVDAELAFRRRLRPAFRALSTSIPALAGLDYIDVRDLEMLRVSPNAWSLGFDHRWTHLAGTAVHMPATPLPPRRQRQLLGMRRALRRWCKATPQILTLPDGPRRARLARRLRSDVVAYVVDARRHAPWPELHGRAASLGLALPWTDAPLDCLTATLAALQAGAAALAAEDGPRHPWRVEGGVPPPTAHEALFLERARDLGDAGLASRDLHTIRRLPICFIEGPAAVVLARGAWLLRSMPGPLPRLGPALLPTSLKAVAWLLDAPGLAAASLVHAGLAVDAPLASDVSLAWRGWVGERVTRARGRMMRRYGPSTKDREAWREVVAGEAAVAYGRGETLKLSAPPAVPDDRAVAMRWRVLATTASDGAAR